MSSKQKTIHGAEPAVIPVGRAKKQCHCGKWFVLPQCHAHRHQSCSDTCLAAKRAEKKAASVAIRKRNCERCGAEFVPRQWQIDVGGGKFCSHHCASQNLVTTPGWRNAIQSRVDGWRKAFAEGRVPIYKGEQHPQWKGGIVATRRRFIESGKSKAKLAAYRRANPAKVKEWGHKRRGKVFAKLPYGTVPELFNRQRGRCAFCGVSIRSGYHLDHVVPLSKGGGHEPLNLQLLCGPCNLRKSAMHPIEFAQRNGRLL